MNYVHLCPLIIHKPYFVHPSPLLTLCTYLAWSYFMYVCAHCDGFFSQWNPAEQEDCMLCLPCVCPAFRPWLCSYFCFLRSHLLSWCLFPMNPVFNFSGNSVLSPLLSDLRRMQIYSLQGDIPQSKTVILLIFSKFREKILTKNPVSYITVFML